MRREGGVGGTGDRGESPSVVCVVLNWNGWEDTVRCLAALSACDYGHLRVVVVDNGSTDGSVEQIRAQFPEIALLEAGRNRGFGAGNNLGIRWGMEAGAVYVWLLNNDTAPGVDALGRMVAVAEADVALGAVGSVLHRMDRPGEVQAWGGGRVNRWMGYARSAETPQPDAWFDYMTAASVLLRAQTLAEVGMFDERIFLYWEDTELGCRIRRAGWRLTVCPEATVLHREGSSTGKNHGLRDRFSTTSGMWFLRLQAPLPVVSWGLFLGNRLLKRALRGEWSRVRAVLRGVGDYWRGASIAP